jgi:hypothetical protein
MMLTLAYILNKDFAGANSLSCNKLLRYMITTMLVSKHTAPSMNKLDMIPRAVVPAKTPF